MLVRRGGRNPRRGGRHRRNPFRQGLRHLALLEFSDTDGDGDGILETVTVPAYDSIGNAVAIADGAGKALERHEYAPYGTRTIRLDVGPPAVEQLRESDGKLLLELSEEGLLYRLQEAIVGGGLTLRDTTAEERVTMTASQLVRDGKQKGRRLLLTPDPAHNFAYGSLDPPAAGQNNAPGCPQKARSSSRPTQRYRLFSTLSKRHPSSRTPGAHCEDSFNATRHCLKIVDTVLSTLDSCGAARGV